MAHGGEVRTNARLQEIVTNDDGSIQHFRMQDDTVIEGDLYVSAMPGWSLPQPHSPQLKNDSGTANEEKASACDCLSLRMRLPECGR